MRKVTNIECRHVVYSKNRFNDTDDAVFVKEQIHYDDGTIEPNLRMLENVERPFFVTRPQYRNHDQKKMFEALDRVKPYKATQRKLSNKVSKALGFSGFNPGLKALARSPYLYGTDIPIEAVVKHNYQTKFPDKITMSTVAVLDIETNMLDGTEEPITCALTYKDKAILAINSNWYNVLDIDQVLRDKFDYYLKDYVKDRNIDLEIVVCKDAADTVIRCIEKAHEWMPDFVAIWNINFDIPKILETLERYNKDAAEVFSDPKTPEAYKFCRYKEGPASKITASGVKKVLAPAERWHTLYHPASFYVIDAMCVYKNIRTAKGLEPSYALDAILNKELGVRKLKFKEADHLTSQLEWHKFMQSNYKAEYCIYNLFDCISVELLQEKVLDLPITINMLSKINDFALFPSQPRRTCNNLHYHALEKGYVIASTSDQMATDLDKLLTSTSKWIITLETTLIADIGLKVLEGLPNISTRIMTFVADLDVSSSYPNGGIACNIESSTTLIETVKILGVSEKTRRIAALNLTAPRVNAYEIVRSIHKAPSCDKLLDAYREWKKEKNKEAA